MTSLKTSDYLRNTTVSSVLFSALLHGVLIVCFIVFSGSKAEQKEKYTEIQFGGTGGTPGGTAEKSFAEQKETLPEDRDVIPDKKEYTQQPVSKSDQGNSPAGTGNPGGTGGNGGGTGTIPGIPTPGTQELPPPKDETWYVAVEEMPEAYGGLSSVSVKAEYPEQAKAANIHGTVYILAYIDESGVVQKTVVAKGLGYGLDESAAKAVRKTRFKPGKKNGKPVRVQLHIPVTF